MNESSMEPSGNKSANILIRLEKFGNKIPDATILFLWLILITLVASFVLSRFGVSAVHPTTGKTLAVVNLLSVEGFQKAISSIVGNFQGFAVMAQVLTCVLGVGVCERSGLFEVLLRQSVGKAKGSDLKIIALFAFVCMIADAAGGVGYVIMPLLGAMVWAAMGRNPIAGMICGYGSTAGAASANVFITLMDVTTAMFTVMAARLIDPNFTASPAINYYFNATACFVQAAASTFVTIKFVEPRLGSLSAEKMALVNEEYGSLSQATAQESKAMRKAIIATIVLFIAPVLLGTIPAGGILRDAATGSLLTSKASFVNGLPFLLSLFFFIPGIVYGYSSGKYQKADDVCAAMAEAMASMSRFIAFAFFISQFLAYFSWSNIGVIVAISSANLLASSGFPIFIVVVLFILGSAFLDFMIGSASAKWGLLGPIFVPMFMLLGYHPSFIQAAYLIGDAIVNPITPGLPYLAILLANVRKYDDSIGLGSLIASLMPYTIAYTIGLIGMLAIWYFFKLPFGPDGPMLLMNQIIR